MIQALFDTPSVTPMKVVSFLRYLFAICSVIFVTSINGQILGYDFTGASSPTTWASGTTNPNLDTTGSFNTLTRGAGAAASSGSNSFRTTGFQNNGISTSNTDYFQVVLRANSGYQLSLSGITANFAGTATYAASPGVSSQWAYSTDGSSFTLIGSPTTTIGTPANNISYNFSGVSALQNVSSTTSVTLRFYASGQTATGGWGFISSALGVNGLAINGTVTAIPEPSTYAALAGVLALGGVMWHRRRQRLAAKV